MDIPSLLRAVKCSDTTLFVEETIFEQNVLIQSQENTCLKHVSNDKSDAL